MKIPVWVCAAFKRVEVTSLAAFNSLGSAQLFSLKDVGHIQYKGSKSNFILYCAVVSATSLVMEGTRLLL